MKEYIDREHLLSEYCSENERTWNNGLWYIEHEPTADVVEIPEGATNGDMVKAMFPNCEQKEHINNGYFEMYFDGDFGNASYMRVSKDWWDAPYKKEVEE